MNKVGILKNAEGGGGEEKKMSQRRKMYEIFMCNISSRTPG